MASLKMDLPMSNVMKRTTLTVNLTGVKTWKFRLWIGGRLLLLAARVMGCGIRIDRP